MIGFAGIAFGVYVLCLEWINRRLGEKVRLQRPGGEKPAQGRREDRTGSNGRRKRIWDPWITLAAAAALTFLTHRVLNLTMPHVHPARPYALVFAGIYAFLSCYRWTEMREAAGDVLWLRR
jgi:hypothetical protein